MMHVNIQSPRWALTKLQPLLADLDDNCYSFLEGRPHFDEASSQFSRAYNRSRIDICFLNRVYTAHKVFLFANVQNLIQLTLRLSTCLVSPIYRYLLAVALVQQNSESQT